MRFIGWIARILMVAAAALVGNYVGEFVREPQREPDEAKMGLVRTSWNGSSVVGIRLNITNFVPALVFAYFAGPPRTIAAFLAGVLVSALVGNRFEPGA